MKALILTEYKRLEYGDMPEPDIGDTDVLVAVKAAAICGSDVHGMDGSSGRRIPPLVMGHEAAGVIEKTGSAVSEWKIGDRVTFDSMVYCGDCWYCRRGDINLCDNRQVLGVSPKEYRRHGAFAEYVAVPERILYRLPDSVSFAQASVVEPLAIAVHAVERTPLSLNDSVLVAGSGMIGLLVIQAARAAGCGTIIALDLEQSKLDKALEFGADIGIIADSPDLGKKISEAAGSRGFDRSFEVVGITPTLSQAIEYVRKGGSVTLVGNISSTVDFPLQSVVTREITLYGTCSSRGEFAACLDLIARKKVNVDALISCEAPLSEGAELFKRLYEREPGLLKVVLKPGG
jgi:L-iditol 2-dehydrogenase